MRRYAAKDWARLAMKFGLVLTDAQLWAAINNHIRDRAEEASAAVREKFDVATDRLDHARRSLSGQPDWAVLGVSFLGGLGVGIGLGMLFTPVSGRQARAAIRGSAADIGNKVSDFASGAARRTTGTDGD
jgi:hypothetical protein